MPRDNSLNVHVRRLHQGALGFFIVSTVCTSHPTRNSSQVADNTITFAYREHPRPNSY